MRPPTALRPLATPAALALCCTALAGAALAQGADAAAPSPAAATGEPAQTVAAPPTEADLLAAYRLKLDTINAGTRKHLPDAADRLILRLDKLAMIDCRPLESFPDQYRCGVLVDTAVGSEPAEGKRVDLVLIKVNQAWKVR